MKAQDEFIHSLAPLSDVHVAAVSQAISALMPRIAAADTSYAHRMEICRRLQDLAYGVSRGTATDHCWLISCSSC